MSDERGITFLLILTPEICDWCGSWSIRSTGRADQPVVVAPAFVCAMMRRMPSLWRLAPLLAAVVLAAGCAPAAQRPSASG